MNEQLKKFIKVCLMCIAIIAAIALAIEYFAGV